MPVTLLEEWPSGELCAATWYLIRHPLPQAVSGSFLLSFSLNVHRNRGGKSLIEVPETQSYSFSSCSSSHVRVEDPPQHSLVSCFTFSERIEELAVLIK